MFLVRSSFAHSFGQIICLKEHLPRSQYCSAKFLQVFLWGGIVLEDQDLQSVDFIFLWHDYKHVERFYGGLMVFGLRAVCLLREPADCCNYRGGGRRWMTLIHTRMGSSRRRIKALNAQQRQRRLCSLLLDRRRWRGRFWMLTLWRKAAVMSVNWRIFHAWKQTCGIKAGGVF